MPNFVDLINKVGHEQSINPGLIEKDYWIMHCLYGLQKMGLSFELKGGTSLSKGFGLINRFSEDIDIQINPTESLPTGKNQNKTNHIKARHAFFDKLATTITIEGVINVERDSNFDDEKMRSAGIRLNYLPLTADLSGVKTGILLEAGFDQVAPNTPCDFTSWAYEYAIKSGVTDIADNRAVRVDCYNPEYTLVEKLHAISRKFRQQQQTGSVPQNFMRHYYDVYHLLGHDPVLSFIGTPVYTKHKAAKFSANDNPDLTSNQAFILSDPDTRKTYEDAYQNTRALYYADMPEFTDILNRISQYATQL